MIQRDHGVYKPTTTETPMRERIARLLARLGDDREENWPNWNNCADAAKEGK